MTKQSHHYHVLQTEAKAKLGMVERVKSKEKEAQLSTSVNIAAEFRGSEDGKRQYQSKLSIVLYVMPMYTCMCTVDSSSHWKYKVA